jgi:hypothetical protein
MTEVQIDLFTVFVAAVLNIIIAFFWYSKWLFGPTWEKLKKMKIQAKRLSWLYGFISSLTIAYFLAFFQGYLGVTTVSDGMFVGFCFWLGFVATTQISSVLWAKGSFRLFLLDTGYKLLSFLVMSGVIGA